ncbi:hypothetical protein CHU92_08405 [Flavobacterium cyanobacteriorum]|uniref:KTSC domain-containing protein n=1 Tax=Flavobacterium cyanobacteriorum TaxID=2022802 RepID=A0A255Z724_9FLAO|nr:hypothetical protein [Flavobacterium cyanobacteriorum]OYQ37347.1 hypothetical protein CHU92_08405 [Flavobacterium cyanobacteriorum]
MKKYKNKEGNSGVTGYEAGNDNIKVEFGHGAVYLYTYASAGKRIIDKMKELAEEGQGLSTYISQQVKDKYEARIK